MILKKAIDQAISMLETITIFGKDAKTYSDAMDGLRLVSEALGMIDEEGEDGKNHDGGGENA